MQRCVYLYESGGQCVAEALGGSDFCEDHAGEDMSSYAGTGRGVGYEDSGGGLGYDDSGLERLDDHPFRKLILRLVAVILLLVFLIPFYFSLKALYSGPPTQAQEGW